MWELCQKAAVHCVEPAVVGWGGVVSVGALPVQGPPGWCECTWCTAVATAVTWGELSLLRLLRGRQC